MPKQRHCIVCSSSGPKFYAYRKIWLDELLKHCNEDSKSGLEAAEDKSAWVCSEHFISSAPSRFIDAQSGLSFIKDTHDLLDSPSKSKKRKPQESPSHIVKRAPSSTKKPKHSEEEEEEPGQQRSSHQTSFLDSAVESLEKAVLDALARISPDDNSQREEILANYILKQRTVQDSLIGITTDVVSFMMEHSSDFEPGRHRPLYALMDTLDAWNIPWTTSLLAKKTGIGMDVMLEARDELMEVRFFFFRSRWCCASRNSINPFLTLF